MLMQAFLSGFCRDRHSKARGGLGRTSGTGFLGCFLRRPSSWGEGGSMSPTPALASLRPLCPRLGHWPLSLRGQAYAAWPAGAGQEDYCPCSQGVKLAVKPAAVTLSRDVLGAGVAMPEATARGPGLGSGRQDGRCQGWARVSPGGWLEGDLLVPLPQPHDTVQERCRWPHSAPSTSPPPAPWGCKALRRGWAVPLRRGPCHTGRCLPSAP